MFSYDDECDSGSFPGFAPLTAQGNAVSLQALSSSAIAEGDAFTPENRRFVESVANGDRPLWTCLNQQDGITGYTSTHKAVRCQIPTNHSRDVAECAVQKMLRGGGTWTIKFPNDVLHEDAWIDYEWEGVTKQVVYSSYMQKLNINKPPRRSANMNIGVMVDNGGHFDGVLDCLKSRGTEYPRLLYEFTGKIPKVVKDAVNKKVGEDGVQSTDSDGASSKQHGVVALLFFLVKIPLDAPCEDSNATVVEFNSTTMSVRQHKQRSHASTISGNAYLERNSDKEKLNFRLQTWPSRRTTTRDFHMMFDVCCQDYKAMYVPVVYSLVSNSKADENCFALRAVCTMDAILVVPSPTDVPGTGLSLTYKKRKRVRGDNEEPPSDRVTAQRTAVTPAASSSTATSRVPLRRAEKDASVDSFMTNVAHQMMQMEKSLDMIMQHLGLTLRPMPPDSSRLHGQGSSTAHATTTAQPPPVPINSIFHGLGL